LPPGVVEKRLTGIIVFCPLACCHRRTAVILRQADYFHTPLNQEQFIIVETKFDVTGIGNAIVDVLAHADDAFLVTEGLTKGAMALIEAEESRRLYEKIGAAIECSGGSAANTIAGLASLGGAGGFIGKVHDDQLGEVFRHDIQALGVVFDCAPTTDGPSTATSMILVTPDAQRTMLTFLGACVDLGPDDVEDLHAKADGNNKFRNSLGKGAREAFIIYQSSLN